MPSMNGTVADGVGRAPSMQIVNLVTTKSLEAQFNPERFSEQLGAAYAKLTVPGLSHQVKQFINTEDVQIDFELFFHSNVSGNQVAQQRRIMEARTFLYATVFPWSSNTIKRGGAPRMLFVWPNFISLTCVVTKVKFDYLRFNVTGAPVVYRAAIAIEEIGDVHLTMNDILAHGTQRSTGE